MTETTVMRPIENLERELVDLPHRVQEAAAAGDRETWMALKMRLDAIPALIREAKARPLRERAERMDAELDRLVSERERAMVGEHEPPPDMHGLVTGAMVKQRVLDNLNRREQQASRERRDLARKISAIETGEDY